MWNVSLNIMNGWMKYQCVISSAMSSFPAFLVFINISSQDTFFFWSFSLKDWNWFLTIIKPIPPQMMKAPRLWIRSLPITILSPNILIGCNLLLINVCPMEAEKREGVSHIHRRCMLYSCQNISELFYQL